MWKITLTSTYIHVKKAIYKILAGLTSISSLTLALFHGLRPQIHYPLPSHIITKILYLRQFELNNLEVDSFCWGFHNLSWKDSLSLSPHCKKRLAFSVPNSDVNGTVNDIPTGDGKIANLFFTVQCISAPKIQTLLLYWILKKLLLSISVKNVLWN